MFGGRSHHYFPHIHASGEEHEIKGKFQQLRDDFLPAAGGTQGFRLEILWDQFQEQLVRRWQQFGELQDARVARRKRSHRGTQGEQERSIEWANDQRDAVGLAVHESLVSRCSKELRKRSFDWSHPLLEL